MKNIEYFLKKTSYVLVMIFTLMSFVFVGDVFARGYNDAQETVTESTQVVMVKYVLQGIMWLILIFVMIAVLKVFIAGIMYVTSGGDEDRMDTAKDWTKESLTWIVVMVVVYLGIDFAKNEFGGELFLSLM